jgi:SAM-dependent methyltransferase
MICDAYYSLAGEYDDLLGDLAESTWRSGILAELARLGAGRGQVIADLGAGTGVGGRLLGETGNGYRRIGIAHSGRMLSRAGRCYEATIIADITMLPVGAAAADVVVSGFDTLNYLSPLQFRRCLASAAGCLKTGGWLIFDYSSPELLRRRWRDYRYDQQLPDGILQWRNRYDSATGTCVSDIERHDADGNVTWHETHIQYALDTYPVHEAAVAAGLRAERVRDLDRPEFSPSASTHLWVLRKETPG